MRTAGQNKFFIFLSVFFLVPRVARIVYPYVWLEDPYYLYAAALIKQGILPFRDFGHTQLPGTEYLLAFFYSLFGNSYVVAEIISQVVIYLNTWLIFLIGKKLCNQTVGVLAALIFSCSSLLFRYHVWEREVLVVFLLTLTFYLFVRWERLNFKRTVVLSILLTLGITIKLTTVVPVMAILFFTIFARKERANTLILAALIFVFSCLAIFLIIRISPENAFNQAFLYHFVKGATFASSIDMLLFPRYVLDLPLALGICGVLFWEKKLFPDFWFPIFLALSEWTFYSFISPNVWPHNYIPSLLLLSLSGGIFIFAVWELFWRERKVIMPCLSILALVLMLIFVCPIKNLNWTMGSTYGFGYIPRRDINQISKFIQSNTTSNDLLLVPQYIAAEAGRKSVISDRIEATGVFRWIEERRTEDHEITEIIEMSKGKSFSQMQSETLSMGWGKINVLLKKNRIKYLVPDIVPGEKIPFSPKYLSSLGYIPVKKIGLYVIWTPRH